MTRPIPFLIAAMTLSLMATAQSSPNSQTINNALEDLTSIIAGNDNGQSRATGSFVSFHQKEDTKGSRLFLKDWTVGFVIAPNDSVVRNVKAVFNYDKINHTLYFTPDKKVVLEVDRSLIKGFDLAAPDGEHLFVKMSAISADGFVELLGGSLDDRHYAFCKLTKTILKKADYHTDGMVETGNNYDEYVDNVQYYIVSPGGKEYQPVELKKKSVRSALPAAKTKVEEFLSQHKNDDVNETFLKELIDYLNKS